jgi:hypothetical protein
VARLLPGPIVWLGATHLRVVCAHVRRRLRARLFDVCDVLALLHMRELRTCIRVVQLLLVM